MKRKLVAMVATVLLSVLVAMPAMAGAAQPPSWKVVSPDLIARSDARQALALEMFGANTGRGSIAKYKHDLSLFVAKWGGARFPSSMQLAQSMPGSQTLAMNQYPEQSPSAYCVSGAITCYCGPSTAESILQYIQPTSHFGEVLINNGDWTWGQYGLAGSFGPGAPKSLNYLETNYWGGETPWFSSRTDWPMSMSFNYWYSGNVNGLPYYTEDPAPYSGAQLTLTTYKAELTSDIWNQGAGGWPLAADVEEYPGRTPYLNGHNTNLEIQHWVPIYGYGGSGDYTFYIDPIYGSALNYTYGFNVNALNPWYPSSYMFALVTYAGAHGGPYGIVW